VGVALSAAYSETAAARSGGLIPGSSRVLWCKAVLAPARPAGAGVDRGEGVKRARLVGLLVVPLVVAPCAPAVLAAIAKHRGESGLLFDICWPVTSRLWDATTGDVMSCTSDPRVDSADEWRSTRCRTSGPGRGFTTT
jgi:hypothetical protein